MKKKAVVSLLTLVTSLTLTACSMQFTTKDGAGQVPDVTNNIYVDIAKELSDIIDNTDFTSEEDLDRLAEELTDWAESYVEESETLQDFQKARLVRVVDGDTIVVDIEGEEYKVRLIGINTPESVASEEYLERTGKENTEEGRDASEFVKNLLANVETVYLQKDISDTDQYGRLLRYVWLELPNDENSIEEIGTKMLNGILVKEGVAEVATYEPDVAHKEDFEYLEEYGDMEME